MQPPKSHYKADLHLHTHYSDGVWPLEKVLEEAVLRGVKGLSITDHDTLEAYPKAFTHHPELTVIPGIELSAHFEETTVHVLGYSFDIKHPRLIETLETLKQARIERMEAILDRLKRRHIHLSLEELEEAYPEGQLTRPHIGMLLVKKGYAPTLNQAFDNYLGDAHMGGLKLKVLTAIEAIELIHEANGFAVLAHPNQIPHRKKLKKILALPFDGIEAFYGNLPMTHVQPFLDLAKTYQKFVTGGSDFHRPQPYLHIGTSFTPDEIFEKFVERHRENNGFRDDTEVVPYSN